MITGTQKIYIKADAAAGAGSSHVIYLLMEGEEVKAVAFSYLSGESQEVSGWFYGEGMKALGLHGVSFSKDSAQAKALLNGFHPETLKPLRPYQMPKPGSRQKGSVIAVELAVTGAKDLSLAQELAPTTEQGRLFVQCIVESRFKANQTLLDAVSWLCQSRTGKAGRGPRVSGKPMFIVFPHRLTREGDMGHHFHNILINSMECTDGKWRAIDLEPFFQKDTMLTLGQLYRDEEARFLNEEFAKHGFGLKAVSYEITNGTSYKLMNARGEVVPEEVRSYFSKRSGQIEEMLAGEGITTPTPRQRRNAALATRVPKKIRGSVAEQQAQWRAEAEQVGLSLASFCPDHSPQIAVDADRKPVIATPIETNPEKRKPEATEVLGVSGTPGEMLEPGAELAIGDERKPKVAKGATSSQRDRGEASPIESEVLLTTSAKHPMPEPESGLPDERSVAVPTPARQRRQERSSPRRDQPRASTTGATKDLSRRIKKRVFGSVV